MNDGSGWLLLFGPTQRAQRVAAEVSSTQAIGELRGALTPRPRQSRDTEQGDQAARAQA